jgi:carboxymethylenebutenolidase
MGDIIQFNRPDGKTCPGYLATPKAGSSAPGFVVIQEWWGLNEITSVSH